MTASTTPKASTASQAFRVCPRRLGRAITRRSTAENTSRSITMPVARPKGTAERRVTPRAPRHASPAMTRRTAGVAPARRVTAETSRCRQRADRAADDGVVILLSGPRQTRFGRRLPGGGGSLGRDRRLPRQVCREARRRGRVVQHHRDGETRVRIREHGGHDQGTGPYWPIRDPAWIAPPVAVSHAGAPANAARGSAKRSADSGNERTACQSASVPSDIRDRRDHPGIGESHAG